MCSAALILDTQPLFYYILSSKKQVLIHERLFVRPGERIRIGYWNRSMMPHPIHLHGHFFKVVHPSLSPDLWVRKDTIIVDPMQHRDIEFFADNLGDWFHHCHNLYHLGAGMANVVSFVKGDVS